MTVKERNKPNRLGYILPTLALGVKYRSGLCPQSYLDMIRRLPASRCRLGVELGSWARVGFFINLPRWLSSLGLYTQSTTRLQNESYINELFMKGGDAVVSDPRGEKR